MKGSRDIGRLLALCSMAGLCIMLPESAHAAEEAAVEYMPQAYGNTLWTLLGGILVMFMQAGFAALVRCVERRRDERQQHHYEKRAGLCNGCAAVFCGGLWPHVWQLQRRPDRQFSVLSWQRRCLNS